MSGSLCSYKNALGEVGKGVHSYRFLGVAIADVAMTVVAAGLIAWGTKYPFWMVLVALFLLGIVLHRLFCVRTQVDRWLFPRS